MKTILEIVKGLPHGEYRLNELMTAGGIDRPPFDVARELECIKGKCGAGWQFRVRRTMGRVIYCILPNVRCAPTGAIEEMLKCN